MISEWVLFKNEFIPVVTLYQSKVYSKRVISERVYWGFHARTKHSLLYLYNVICIITKLVLGVCKRYPRDGTLDFWGGWRLGQIPGGQIPGGQIPGEQIFVFRSLPGRGGEEGDQKWIRMLLVPLRVKKNQRPKWYVLGCFSLNITPEISITGTILMIWLEPLEHIDQGIFIFGIFQLFAFDINCCHSYTEKTQVPI